MKIRFHPDEILNSNFMGQVGQAIENDLLKGLKGQGIERRWRWLCWWALMNAIMASELWISWVVWSSCSAHAIFNNQDNDRLWHCPSFATRGWWFSVCNAMIRCICCKQITINPFPIWIGTGKQRRGVEICVYQLNQRYLRAIFYSGRMLYARTMAVYKHLNPDGIRFASKSLILFHGASRFLTTFRNDRGIWAFCILFFYGQCGL